MKLTSFTDYSLRVLIYLAAQPERRATIGEIAACFEVSEHHLTKVAHFLGKHGWLANVRGKGGGLALARAPASINVGDVVRQTEGSVVVECFADDGGHCRITGMCRMSGVLSEALAAFHSVLDRYSLEDLLHNRDELTMLFTPRAHADLGRGMAKGRSRDVAQHGEEVTAAAGEHEQVPHAVPMPQPVISRIEDDA